MTISRRDALVGIGATGVAAALPISEAAPAEAYDLYPFEAYDLYPFLPTGTRVRPEWLIEQYESGPIEFVYLSDPTVK